MTTDTPHDTLPPTTTEVAAYSATEAALAELRATVAGATFDCSTAAGDKQARDSRLILVRLRTTLEAKRKELKAPLLEQASLIDTEAKRITGEILKLEAPIDAAIKAEEQRREARRAELLRQQREREQAIAARLDALRNRALELVGAPADLIATAIAEAETETLDADTFGEQLETAQAAHTAMLAKLRELHATAVSLERQRAELRAQREAQERARAAEQARLDAERAELDRLRAEDAARQAEAARVAAEERARADREAAAERDRLAAEAEAERQRLAAEQAAELERQRAEQAAEAARLAAERAAAEQRAAAAKARAEAKAIERATLHSAAREAIELLDASGHGEHLTTRKLAAALARETAHV